MPSPKQMEKLAAEAARQPATPAAAPEAPLPAEYWDSLLKDPRAVRDFDGGTQKTYQRMISEMDLQIGRVLEALNANGQAENTIVIFTSDNGGERFADTWPFTGRKTDCSKAD